MATVPDDIKIIAQFLAEQSRADDWQALTRHALRLKRDLNQRGAYRIVRQEKRSLPRSQALSSKKREGS